MKEIILMNSLYHTLCIFSEKKNDDEKRRRRRRERISRDKKGEEHGDVFLP